MKIPAIKTKLASSISYTSSSSETCYFDFEVYFDVNKINRYLFCYTTNINLMVRGGSDR